MSRYVEYDYDHECIICLDGEGKLQNIIQAQFCEQIDDELEQLFLEIPDHDYHHLDHASCRATKKQATCHDEEHEEATLDDLEHDKQASITSSTHTPYDTHSSMYPPLYIQAGKQAMSMYPNYATPGTPNGKSPVSQLSPISPVSPNMSHLYHVQHTRPVLPLPDVTRSKCQEDEDYVQTRVRAGLLPRAPQQGLDQFDASASDKRLAFGASDERTPDVIDTVSREDAHNGELYEVYGSIGVADSYQWRFILHGDSKMIVGLIDADIAGPQEMAIYFDFYQNQDVLTSLFGTEKPKQGMAIMFIYDVDLQQLIIKNNEPGHAYKGREYIVKRDIDVSKRYKLSLLLLDKALIQVW